VGSAEQAALDAVITDAFMNDTEEAWDALLEAAGAAGYDDGRSEAPAVDVQHTFTGATPAERGIPAPCWLPLHAAGSSCRQITDSVGTGIAKEHRLAEGAPICILGAIRSRGCLHKKGIKGCCCCKHQASLLLWRCRGDSADGGGGAGARRGGVGAAG